VYAPHEPHLCRALRELMMRELPNTYCGILLGNFNMVGRRSDKSDTCSKYMPHIERLLFNSLKDTLQVLDPPLTMPSLLYFWDNGRQDSSRIIARLDRMYTCSDLVKKVVYRIRGNPGEFTLYIHTNHVRTRFWTPYLLLEI